MPPYLIGIDREFEQAFEVGRNNENVYFLHVAPVGVFVCIRRGDEVTAHPIIAKGARGKSAVAVGKAIVKYWFDNGVERLHTRCKRELKHALMYNYSVGLRRYAEDENFIFYEVRR